MPRKGGGDSDSDDGGGRPSAPPAKSGKAKGREDKDTAAKLAKKVSNLALSDDSDTGGRGKVKRGGKKDKIMAAPSKAPDSDDSDNGGAKRGGRSAAKKAAAAAGTTGAAPSRANPAKSRHAGRRGGDSSESDAEEAGQAAPPRTGGDGKDTTASKPKAPSGAAKGGKKKRKGGRGGDDSDDDGDGDKALPGGLTLPGGSAAARRAALLADEEAASAAAQKRGKARGGNAPAGGSQRRGAANDEEDKEEDQNEDAQEDEDADVATTDVASVTDTQPPPPSAAAAAASIDETPAAPSIDARAITITDSVCAPISADAFDEAVLPTTQPSSAPTNAVDAAAAATAAPVEDDGDAIDFSSRKKKKKKPVAASTQAVDANDAEGAVVAAATTAAAPAAATQGAPAPATVFFGEAELGAAAAGAARSSAAPGSQAADGTWVGLDGETVADDVGKALAKRLRGDGLSNKERRLLVTYDEDRERAGPLNAGFEGKGGPGDEYALSNFSLSQAQKHVAANDAAGENAKDINVENFTITAHKKELFKSASLKISHGRRYGLVGPNGQGKTTLLKHIAARELAIPPRIDVLYVEQEVIADDTPAITAVLRADRVRSGLLDEETRILAELDAADAAESEGVRAGRLTDAERGVREDRLNAVYNELAAMKAEASESTARRILSGLGFTADMQERPTKHFSGGWRMRISLARALFMQPTLLLLDEPTNHLDLNAVIWLEDYLTKWKNTLLIVSHDQDFLTTVVTDIIHLEDCKLYYYKGNYDDFKEMHKQKVEKQLKDYEKQQKMLRTLKDRGKSSKDAVDKAISKAKRDGAASKKSSKKSGAGGAGAGGGGTGDDGHDGDGGGGPGGEELIARPKEYAVRFTFNDPPELSPPVLAVSGASFRYGPSYPWLFNDLNFGIDQSSRVSIVGPNGVGKSTLLNLLTGDLEATEGTVTRNRFLKVGKYSQHFVDVLPMDRSPVEYLQSAYQDQSYQACRNLLGRFGLEGHAHTIPCKDLSGGQKARVVFASLCLMAPHIMVLDEPTNNLDIESIDALGEALRDFKGGVVLVSHDARLIRQAECNLWVCDKQDCSPYDGEYEDYKASLMESIHAAEAVIEDEMARRAREEEEARMAAARIRAQRRNELRAAANKQTTTD